jgi:hypothetical protein
MGNHGPDAVDFRAGSSPRREASPVARSPLKPEARAEGMRMAWRQWDADSLSLRFGLPGMQR